MDRESLNARFTVAKKAAEAATLFLLSHEALRSEVKEKGGNDYVTAADGESERIIREIIHASFPEDSILGEELGGERGEGPRWIIDPIDGTVDFMSSFPCYTVSIAFEDEKGLAIGVISVPRQHEVFSAMRGEGAYLNDKRIHTDEMRPAKEGLAILVPPHRFHDKLDGYIVTMRKFYEVFSDTRSIGSAALSICYVACGRALMYYETALHDYDVAAGIVILKEAGGKVTLLSDDAACLDIVVSSASVHEKTLEIIR